VSIGGLVFFILDISLVAFNASISVILPVFNSAFTASSGVEILGPGV